MVKTTDHLLERVALVMMPRMEVVSNVAYIPKVIHFSLLQIRVVMTWCCHFQYLEEYFGEEAVK